MLRNGDELNYGFLPPANYNVDHIPVGFLIDTSGSMLPRIKEVCAEMNRLIYELSQDSITSKMIDTAIMGFNDSTYLFQDWRPVTEVNTIDLEAGGGTELGPALIEMVKLIQGRGHEYEDRNIVIRVPCLVLITDGYGGDVEEAARLIRKRTDERKLQLWTFCVGDYDKKTVARLTDGVRVYELKNENSTDFSEFFQGVIGSVLKVVSRSHSGEAVTWKNPVTDENSTLKVPNLDNWLIN